MKFLTLSILLLCAFFVPGGRSGAPVGFQTPNHSRSTGVLSSGNEQEEKEKEKEKELAFANAFPKAFIQAKKFEHKMTAAASMSEGLSMEKFGGTMPDGLLKSIPKKDQGILRNIDSLLDPESMFLPAFQDILGEVTHISEFFDQYLQENNVPEKTRAQVFAAAFSKTGMEDMMINTEALVSIAESLPEDDKDEVDDALAQVYKKMDEIMGRLPGRMISSLDDQLKKQGLSVEARDVFVGFMKSAMPFRALGMNKDAEDEKLQQGQTSDEAGTKGMEMSQMLKNVGGLSDLLPGVLNKADGESKKGGMSDDTKAKLGLLMYASGLVLLSVAVGGML